MRDEVRQTQRQRSKLASVASRFQPIATALFPDGEDGGRSVGALYRIGTTRRRGSMTRTARIAITAALMTIAPTAAQSANEDGVKVELNKLEPTGSACRAYLVFQNATDYSFEPFKLDLVMFNAEGVIAQRLAIEAGPLPAGKTSVKLFDINGQSCNTLDRFLLNSVLACGTASDDTPDCTALARTSSRAKADFLK